MAIRICAGRCPSLAAPSLAIVLAVAVAACGGAAVPDASAAPSVAPVEASPTPAAQPTVAPEASLAPTPKPLPVSLVKRTKVVRPGDTASITVETREGAECSMEVFYESGASSAGGQGDKKAKAKADGLVTWRRMVGTNTNPQKADIVVTCELGERTGTLTAGMTVKE